MQPLAQSWGAGTPGHRALPHCVAILLAALISLASTSAHAQYRCVQPSGSVSYQQAPCAMEAKGKKLELSSSATSTPGGKEDRTDWAAVIRGPAAAAAAAASAPGLASAAGSPETPSRNCATPQQIKSMEYEASKLSNRRNAGMQRDLANARGCR